MAKDESNKKSILAKIKGVFFLVPKALIYPIKKPFASIDEMKHDAKVSLKKAVSDVPKEEEKYDPPIETTKASENLGIEIISYKDGKIKFLASRTLVGDVSHLSPKQLGQIKEVLPNIDVFREENKVIIEVDVEEITKEIKNASENKGKSPEEIKGLIIEQIKQKVDGDLKKLAKITGGELERHTDRKLLYGIAEKLYREYGNRLSETAIPLKKSSETVVPKKSLNTAEPNNEIIVQNNMTNPREMYHLQPEVIAGKASKVQSFSREQQVKEQARELGSILNFEDVSFGEAIKPLSTPSTKGDEGKGRS
ncbi:hypothetical protein [Wolbachia endosymbiont of Tribolium confusum]|uniref:hypothetical protein n=1 Tax=Wolbachia endosymbiont of Tribolium confusum TaxID=214474 RepID=UPI001CF27C85|nr:hypothetical protein [Wolbachia endosymbiont of Tribolium confusum]MCA7009944.1 hypothetical protein [Wolbachia endosymbiont of Tribolium confusum]